ncbi:HlyD family type I secretion periplasmic adaptor subunit [Halomonas urumqiensis]|uniref:Membrane fusion protein (MFP) family protein n=1 Tax=Halomonas urumqiensis TaxID=1684789 RepID=A0A2N7UD96_9GAMM|nr:HlyD family type I secretion periplasmic adaptor subunit [Halomonas urumqiensis]PMR78361.1 HlyD family type I secretion periplasmic adaptor subunit [Halomonas urumqiensis]PTB03508.1 HlyD family type I secretion periplasmic adaptor subunit [Halomonas urumqiensis]GHE20302.1 metalloprotease secretion protein [Halomonas urumqiensis]
MNIAVSPYTQDFLPAEGAPVDLDTNDRRPMVWGLLLIMLGFGGFIGWATLAPLDAGVVANATVKVTSNRKTIQHLEGGYIESILVREGDRVVAGQELLRLDATEAMAEQGVVSTQYIIAQSVEDRLQAERDGQESVAFDPWLAERFASDPRLAAATALQSQLFYTRQSTLEGERMILSEKLNSATQRLAGLEQVEGFRNAQVGHFSEELRGMRKLAAEGYIPRNRLLELERSSAQVSGSRAETTAEIGRTRSEIAELRLQLLQLDQVFHEDIQSRLAEQQQETASLADRLRSLDYQVNHTVVRSPIDGVVLGVNVTTEGGVIQPGQALMDIVPQDEPLQVDAMVPVQAIDKLEPGLNVDITFPAFNHAQTPNIPGQVKTVSADRLVDEESGMPYYLAEVEVLPQGTELLGLNRIRAGMPASVTIKTGERNLLSYLLKPLLDRIDSAFKEQ